MDIPRKLRVKLLVVHIDNPTSDSWVNRDMKIVIRRHNMDSSVCYTRVDLMCFSTNPYSHLLLFCKTLPFSFLGSLYLFPVETNL